MDEKIEKVEKIEKKKWDSEYSTQFLREVKFLKEQNIRYAFVKTVDNLSTFKYEKTPELFEALRNFYGAKRALEGKKAIVSEVGGEKNAS